MNRCWWRGRTLSEKGYSKSSWLHSSLRKTLPRCRAIIRRHNVLFPGKTPVATTSHKQAELASRRERRTCCDSNATPTTINLPLYNDNENENENESGRDIVLAMGGSKNCPWVWLGSEAAPTVGSTGKFPGGCPMCEFPPKVEYFCIPDSQFRLQFRTRTFRIYAKLEISRPVTFTDAGRDGCAPPAGVAACFRWLHATRRSGRRPVTAEYGHRWKSSRSPGGAWTMCGLALNKQRLISSVALKPLEWTQCAVPQGWQ